jgi:hypothetical protein
MVGIEFWPKWKKFIWGFYSFVYFPLFLFIPAASIYFHHPIPFSFNLILALGALLPVFVSEIRRLLFPALAWLYRGATGIYTWTGRETRGPESGRPPASTSWPAAAGLVEPALAGFLLGNRTSLGDIPSAF